jgi:DNA-directed RNA polymerase specialized sigma24 family protein
VTDGARSFVSYFDEHYPPVFRALCVGLRDRELAAESAQHALIRARARWNRPRGSAPSAIQLYSDASRHAIRRVGATSMPRRWDSEPGTLARAIEELPTRERLALVLHHRAGMSYAELGRALRCPADRAASTLREAHRRVGVSSDDYDIPEVELDDP